MNSLNENLSSLNNTFDRNSLSYNNMNKNNFNELTKALLYKRMTFNLWQKAFYTIENWAKTQEFNIVYNHVIRKPDKRTVQCKYQGNYRTKTNTITKRIGYTWHINLLESSSNNPFKYIYITTFTGQKFIKPTPIRYQIGVVSVPNIIARGPGAAMQCKYLETKFSSQTIYNNNLYKTIQNFWPQNKNNSNDAAKLYTKLPESSLNNSI
ncbi:hypothetical protein Glove_92g23 [Diversispora epigaea]|uniref:Uncharacterized protein n=1 Tax=Diversispora epigaea TaxID=1348612 RepID=A0A397J9M4_9GLOM|nr:hypothetical protein Glove_92g23 [Diversispora epigaea]